MNALEQTDTSKVWMETDDVTTTVRGKTTHVFDVTKAIFLYAAVTGKHVAFQGTYSIGCPGESDGNVYMAEDDDPQNKEAVKAFRQPVSAKFSLYPLGCGDYMEVIYEQIKMLKQQVTVMPFHYSTKLTGETNAIFLGLEQAFRAVKAGGSSHTIMTVSISANSPSHGK
jgi:uncharacterized protein YqgV (UPF0045/DUF77 family)